MDILMVNPFFYPYPGGTEKHIREIGKRLAKKGHRIVVLSAQMDKKEQEREIFEGMEVHRTPAKIIHNLPHPLPPPYPIMTRFFQDYKNILEKNKFDFIHIHNRFIFGHRTLNLAKPKSKTILTIHNARPRNIDPMTDTLGGLYDDVLGKGIMNRMDGIIGVSGWALNSTIPNNYTGKTGVIHNGCDVELYSLENSDSTFWKDYFEMSGDNEGEKMLLTNSRLVKQKGLEHLVDSMQYVKDAYLVVLGRGPLESELKKRAKKLKVPVYFLTKKISEEELINLYSSAYLFVLSSLYEPCAVALMEAQASGKAIVATNAGGNPEIVQEGETGLLANPADAEDLADKINNLINDEKLVRQFGKNARLKAEKYFNWDFAANATENFYTESKGL
ncbi:glycosyltransferase family 4 protein [Candidatus Micrarchaeota archaeon]|nr:glycosyltransferase family 4 protein [Candidatus Micrarchaeota archaeon]